MTYEDCVHEFLGIGMPATLRRIEEWLGRPLPDGWEAELDAAVTAGKPDPDLVFYAAERMGVVPERCIVVEDSPGGVAAAVAAGPSPRHAAA